MKKNKKLSSALPLKSFPITSSSPSSSCVVCRNITVPKPRPWSDYWRFRARKSPTEFILKDANATFEMNRLNAILGPSGSGKTTLLKACFVQSTLLPEDRGHVSLVGGKWQPESLIACFVSQFPSLHEDLTVNENFNYAFEFKYTTEQFRQRAMLHYQKTSENIIELANVRNLDKKKLKQYLIQYVQEKLGIAHIGQNRVATCSGGEGKRIAIALELLCPPHLLVLDEPTTGLDSMASQSLISYLRILTESLSLTVLATIHQPNYELLCTFHNSYFMNTKGRCVYSGSPEQLLRYFKNFQLTCPNHYNPANLMLDIANGEYGHQVLARMYKIQKMQIDFRVEEYKSKSQILYHQVRYRPSTVNLRQALLISWQWLDLQLKSRVLVILQAFSFLLYPLILGLFLDRRLALYSGCPPNHLLPATPYNWSTIRSWNETEWESFEFTQPLLRLERIEHIRQFNVLQEKMLLLHVKCYIVFTCLLNYALLVLAAYTFPSQLQIFYNQRLNGYYSFKSYLLSKSVADIPVIVFICLVSSFVCYLTIGYPAFEWQYQKQEQDSQKINICESQHQSKMFWDLEASEYDRIDAMIKDVVLIEQHSQNNLFYQFCRYYFSTLAMLLTAQVSGMATGIMLWFNMQAAIFVAPLGYIPHFLYTEVLKDKSLHSWFWRTLGGISPIRNAIRMQIISIFRAERCDNIRLACDSGSDFLVSHTLIRRWLQQQLGVNSADGTATRGVTNFFVIDLMNNFFGDYLIENETKVIPQFLKRINIADEEYNINFVIVYIQVIIYRLVMLAILYYKGRRS